MPETTDARIFTLEPGQNTIDLSEGQILELCPRSPGDVWLPLMEVSLESMAPFDRLGTAWLTPVLFTRLPGGRARLWPTVSHAITARTRRVPGLEMAREILSRPYPVPKPEITNDGMFQTLKSGSTLALETDLDWLTSEGPLERRMLLTPEEGKAILERIRPPQPGAPAPPTDLDSALDDLRLAGVMCGVQVVSREEVVCWIGDIQEAFVSATQPNWRAWGPTVTQFTCLFHKTWGANALEDAAKWMRERMPWTEGPAGTHGTARGVAGRG